MPRRICIDAAVPRDSAIPLALEDIDVDRHRIFMQWRAAARLDDPDDGDDLWLVRLRIGDRLLVAGLIRF